MERDVKRYDCNVTYWGGETGTESVYACVVWGERAIGTVHSTEFIQLNARRCVYTQGTLLPLLLLLFSMLLLFKWTCASSLFRHSVLTRADACVCVCAQCFFSLWFFSQLFLGSDCRCFVCSPSPAFASVTWSHDASQLHAKVAYGTGLGSVRLFDSKIAQMEHVCVCFWAFPFDAIATMMRYA